MVGGLLLNQSLFKPRALLLGDRIDGGWLSGCANRRRCPGGLAQHCHATGFLIRQQQHACQRQHAGNADGQQLHVGSAAGSASMNSSKSATAGRSASIDSSTSATAASGAGMTPKDCGCRETEGRERERQSNAVASATPRSTAGTQSQTAASSNPADNRFRAELRNCVQQSGDQRESCLDRAIENHQQS